MSSWKNLSMVAVVLKADAWDDMAVFGRLIASLDTPLGFLLNGRGFNLKSFFRGWGKLSALEWPPRPSKYMPSVLPENNYCSGLKTSSRDNSMVSMAACYRESSRFKSRQGSEWLILNKKKLLILIWIVTWYIQTMCSEVEHMPLWVPTGSKFKKLFSQI